MFTLRKQLSLIHRSQNMLLRNKTLVSDNYKHQLVVKMKASVTKILQFCLEKFEVLACCKNAAKYWCAPRMKVWPLDFPSLATKCHQKCFKEKWLFSLNFVLLLSTPFTLSRTQTVCLLSQSFFPILSLCFSHSSLPSHSHHLTFYLSAPINFSLMMFFTFLSSLFIPNLLTLSLSLTQSLSLWFEFLSLSHAHSLSLSFPSLI